MDWIQLPFTVVFLAFLNNSMSERAKVNLERMNNDPNVKWRTSRLPFKIALYIINRKTR